MINDTLIYYHPVDLTTRWYDYIKRVVDINVLSEYIIYVVIKLLSYSSSLQYHCAQLTAITKMADFIRYVSYWKYSTHLN